MATISRFELKPKPDDGPANTECPCCTCGLVLTVWLDDSDERDKQYQKLQALIMGLKLEIHRETLLAMLRECRKVEKPEKKAEILDKILRTEQKMRADEINAGATMPPMLVIVDRAKGMEIAKEDYDKTGMPDEGEGAK